MSTRGCYIFKDDIGEYCVYKHMDNYPEGAKRHIAMALVYAWPLPRFEADEFGAAFIAANKDYSGDLRLLLGGWDTFPCDIEYVYQVEFKGQVGDKGKLKVTAWEVSNDYETGEWTKKSIPSWTVKPLAARSYHEYIQDLLKGG